MLLIIYRELHFGHTLPVGSVPISGTSTTGSSNQFTPVRKRNVVKSPVISIDRIVKIIVHNIYKVHLEQCVFVELLQEFQRIIKIFPHKSNRIFCEIIHRCTNFYTNPIFFMTLKLVERNIAFLRIWLTIAQNTPESNIRYSSLPLI